MTEYSNEWLLEKAKASREILQQLPRDMRDNLGFASAALPTTTSIPERSPDGKATYSGQGGGPDSK